MKYLQIRPETKLSREEIIGLFDEEPQPPTERRPDLAQGWARRMNEAIEVSVCPTCEDVLIK